MITSSHQQMLFNKYISRVSHYNRQSTVDINTTSLFFQNIITITSKIAERITFRFVFPISITYNCENINKFMLHEKYQHAFCIIHVRFVAMLLL